MNELSIPPWISYRSYDDLNGEFALIGNAKSHELVFIEHFHVNIMNDVVILGLQKSEILKKYSNNVDDVNNIINEFVEH